MRRTGANTNRVSFPVQCLVLAAITLVWLGVLRFHPDDDIKQMVSNVGLATMALAAAVRCGRKALPASGRIRVAWGAFGAACLSWGIGQAIWTWYENVLDEAVPFPSIADIGYLGLVPLTVVGLLALPTASDRFSSRALTVLDGLIIATSLLFVSWATVLPTVYESVDGGFDHRLVRLVGLAYPLGDVVLITVLLLGFVRTRRLDLVPRWTLALLSGGLVSFAVADSGFAYQTARETYASGDLIDAGWFVGFGLIFLAASRGPMVLTGQLEPVERRSTVLVPYIAVLSAVLLGVTKLSLDGRLGPRLGWTALALLSLIVLRQVLTLIENVSLTRDLEERVHARTEQLHQSEQRFRSLVQHSSDVTTLIRRDRTVTYQSSSGERVFGHGADEVVGRDVLDVVHPDDRPQVAATLQTVASTAGASTVIEFSIRGDGDTWRQTETTITNMLDNPSVGGLVLNTRDVSDRRSLQRELVHSAFHDPLTQLVNRRLFHARLEQALAAAGRPNEPITVLFLDLDDFKAVNDSYGHASGDLVLVEVGERLLECVRATDTVARLGGDEFAVLLERVSGRSEVNAVARRICETLRFPFRLEEREVFLGGSVGIAASTPGGETADDLLRNADLAMYEAKSEHAGSYRWYEPAMHSCVLKRLEIDGDMRRALERGELFLEYQPIIDLTSGSVTGAEALVRWNHPTRGTVGPSEFIPVAEGNGLVAAIGEWVVDEACQQLRRWQDLNGGRPLSMSVNLSGRQLDRSEIAQVVSDALERSGLHPSQLVLEMTETIFIAQTDRALGNVHALKDLGVRLAVDDFGTGYSALSYLHRLPVDMIKIDKLFVDRLTALPEEAGLAASIVRIGQDLRLVTVAEGVEQRFQLDVLRSIGCNQVQGFLLARPVSPAVFGGFLGCDGRFVSSSDHGWGPA